MGRRISKKYVEKKIFLFRLYCFIRKLSEKLKKIFFMLYLFTVKHFSAIHILQKPHFTFFKSEKLCWVGIRFFFEQSTNILTKTYALQIHCLEYLITKHFPYSNNNSKILYLYFLCDIFFILFYD